jgi:4-amino-4-deoxy-L-arabinose transferase-like glycosyltransferase
LPTWLLAIAIKVFGATPYATYGVAALMVTGTGVFTYLIARELLGARVASIAIVLWGLHWAFTWKAQLLNHNSVMMCFIAIAAWLAIRAGRRVSAWGWWTLLGLASGLAMLSKYQSAVPLVGVIIALWRAGSLRRRDQVLGLVLAVAISLAVFAPHVAWVVTHDFVTLKYASTTVHQLSAMQRVSKLLSFTALHLRMVLPVLLCMGALALWSRWARADTTANEADADNEKQRRAWMLGLLGWPLLILAVLCITQGVRLQDHWGFQAVQFVSLWLAWQLRRLGPAAAGRLVALALLTHALSVAVYSRSVWDPRVLTTRGTRHKRWPTP